MKRAILYISIIFVLVLCVLSIRKINGTISNPPSDTQQSHESIAINNLNPPQSTSVRLPVKSALTETDQPPSNSSTNKFRQQQIDSLRAAFNTWSNQVQRPIEFYGKVVDENAQPVSGVGIAFGCSQHLTEQYFETSTISGYDGLFSISGLTGSTLSVRVGKNGYYAIKSNPTRFDYMNILNTGSFQPNHNNPVIFHLRKKGIGVDLISATLNVKIQRDGTIVRVDFLNKTFGATGQFQMSQTKPPYESWKKATAWSFHMTIPDGGFIEQNDEFPFEAPESGYRSAIDFDFKANEPAWETGFKKNYYIVFGNPPRYGQMTIETDIMSGGARLTYAINPDGSRNLEPKDSSQ
jgi:hypothetical protein